MRRLIAPTVVLPLAILAAVAGRAPQASAQAAASASYRLTSQTLNGGLGDSSSSNYDATACLAPEPEAGGTSNSTSYLLQAGCAAAVVQNRCGDGILVTPEQCDDGNTQNGDCCSSTCQFESSSTVCRPAAGECDVAEMCTGSSSACPADAVKPAATACTSDGNDCKKDECDGSGVLCTHPNEPTNTSCGNPSDTDCDNPDTCNGSGVCLSNHEPANTTCTSDGLDCTKDVCDSSGTCTHPNEAVNTPCGDPSDTDCDNPDTCNGSGTCLVNHAPANSVCTSDGNDCTQDHCDTNGVCVHPAEATNTPCGDPSDTDCDNPDSCNGSGVCAPRNEPNGTPCFGSNNNNCLNTCQSGACTADVVPNCCGNGIVEGNEQCDDGNQLSGTGDACPSGSVYHCNYSTPTSGLLVRGNLQKPARAKSSCQVEWFVLNPNNPPDRYGLPNAFQGCEDQDPTCDLDPTPGRCQFDVVACVNNDDPNLPACPQMGVQTITVLPQRARLLANPVTGPLAATNNADVADAVEHLFDPANPGAGFNNTPPVDASQVGLCSGEMRLAVLAASPKPKESARLRFTIRTKSIDMGAPHSHRQRSTLHLTCRARRLP